MFLTISLLHESWRNTGQIGALNAQVRDTKLRQHFLQQTHLMHSIGPKTQVLGLSGLFRYCTKVDVKLAEMAPLTRKFAKWSCVGPFHNERTRSTPLDPKLIFWRVSDYFVTARKSMQDWPNWRHKRISSLNEVALEFFTTSVPDPLHRTQNSCFGKFRTVSLLHESRCKTGRTVAINVQVC
jgi:hypothetical protein